MELLGPCPVPPDQRPLRQYEELRGSWFFAWPAESLDGLMRPLLISWLLVAPLSVLVASGSWVLRHDPARMVVAGAAAAIALPTLLLVRQWLGWSTIHRRLVSERVDYEESGWYDGQVWEKPLSWRQQDLLVAQHQVRPILARLQQAIGLAATLMLLGASLCQAL
ncbi:MULTISPECIES: CGLD27 family protein [unclassified Cyanobium]|jgi:hypothetical protein|uniref:CGLD27 family protein n=1 Tax=unclassified Cyanobium TaxID=2627006 RepID=UPI0016488635|nr:MULTISPECIES: CGLD27 family protein [unclassified Cyanobium]MBE9153707.1 CGLD27 family protein [Cyanobium sp. LEGE 06113]QNI71082.1 CGLD27-like uncharacterized conserved membrane protein [Cyanobium sp. NS01]